MKEDNMTYNANEMLQITDLSWERIFLNVTITSEYQTPLTFSFARVSLEGDFYADIKSEVSITPEQVTGSSYHFRLNMSTIKGGSFPENGRWVFIAREADSSNIIVSTISHDAVYDLVNMDRVFPYRKSRYSYTVHFTKSCFDSVNIIPILNSRFMIENPDWADTLVVSQRKTIAGKLRCLHKKFKLDLLQLMYNVICLFHKNDGKHVLLMSETKPYLWGNLKYIDERIKERGLDTVLHISHSFRLAVGKHNGFFSWYKTLRLIALNDFIFVDDFAPLFSFLNLNKRTKLIQVWHAGEGFKAVGYGRFGMNGSPHPAKICHRKYDHVVTGSERLVDVYSEVFGLPKDRFLPLGMARLDGFLDPDVISSKKAGFYSLHPECVDKKLILFCPTFRGTGQKSAYYNYEQLDMQSIYDFCGDEYIWAFKMHPFIKQSPDIAANYCDRIIDLSDYKDINDLYYVTDIMITDYSSAYYEFSLMQRPILFFTYDRVVYENIRGVHKSIAKTAPGKVCDSFEELITALKTKDYEFEKTLQFYNDNFKNYDGNAADKIIDTIILGKSSKEDIDVSEIN